MNCIQLKNMSSKSFNRDSHLHMVIATVAFGMGVDCYDVTQVIHVLPPTDVESYRSVERVYSRGYYIRSRDTITIVMTYLHREKSYCYGGTVKQGCSSTWSTLVSHDYVMIMCKMRLDVLVVTVSCSFT